MRHSMARQTDRQNNFGQAVFAILRKIKREPTPLAKSQPFVGSHSILPNRTHRFSQTTCLIQKQNKLLFRNLFIQIKLSYKISI